MLRNARAGVMLGLVLVLTLGACAPDGGLVSEPGSTATPPVDDGRTVIRVGTGDSGDGLRPHQEIIARFEAANPDIHVIVEPVTGDYYGELFTQIDAGSPPDIMQIGDDAVPSFVDRGALVSLDEFIGDGASPFDTSIYLPGVLEPGRWAGGQYLLPKDFSPLVIYYNKRIFDRFGVAYPQDGWGWADFLSAAQALTKDTDGDGQTDIWGVQLPGAWATSFEYWSAAAGGRLVSPEGVGFLGYMDAPQNVDALQFYTDLYHRYSVAPIPSDPNPFMPGHDEFRDGKAAMWLFGRWPQADLLKDADVDLGVVGVPAGRRRANILLWSGFGIAAKSSHHDAAWRFLRFYAGAEGAESWKNWGLPTVTSVARNAGLYEDAIERVWLSELDHIVPRAYLQLPLWPTAGDPLLRKLLERAVSDPNLDVVSGLYDTALEAQGQLTSQR